MIADAFWGFLKLDDAATPGPGQVCVLAAGTGMGKSTICCQAAYVLASESARSVAFVTTHEMKSHVAERFAAMSARVAQRWVWRAERPADDDLRDAMGDRLSKVRLDGALSRISLHSAIAAGWDDSPLPLLADACRQLPGATVIFDCVSGPGGALPSWCDEGRAFASIARSRQVPVVVASQVTRPSPDIDLDPWAVIEREGWDTSSVDLAIHLDHDDEGMRGQASPASVALAATRDGPVETVAIAFDAPSGIFREA